MMLSKSYIVYYCKLITGTLLKHYPSLALTSKLALNIQLHSGPLRGGANRDISLGPHILEGPRYVYTLFINW